MSRMKMQYKVGLKKKIVEKNLGLTINSATLKDCTTYSAHNEASWYVSKYAIKFNIFHII